MIKINLLPYVSKKRIEFKRQIFLSGIFLLVLLVIILSAYIAKVSKISDLVALREAKRMELQSLQHVQNKIKKLQSRKSDLEDRIELIEQLEARRGGPVKLLYVINCNIPAYLWLTKLTTTGRTVELNGEALSHTYPADLVSSLKTQKDIFSDVDLIYTREKRKLEDVSVVDFGINCQLAPQQKEKKVEQATQKGGKK